MERGKVESGAIEMGRGAGDLGRTHDSGWRVSGHAGFRELTDAELIRRICGGQSELYTELMERYAVAVTAYVYGNVSVPSDRDDLVQEIFVTAYRRLGTLRNAHRFGPWIMRISRNRVTDHHRRGARERYAGNLAAKSEGAPVRDAAHSLSEEQLFELVSESIGRMGPVYRTVLHMRLLAELAPVEIARVLGLRESTVRMRLKRGLEKLRHDLKRKGLTQAELNRYG